MEVTVELYGLLRSKQPAYDAFKGVRLEAKEGTNLKELVRRLGIKRDELGLIIINGISTKDYERIITDKSIVQLFSHIPHGG